MHALTAHPDVSPGDRLGATALVAVLAHLIVILGVTFVPQSRPERHAMTLDVVLVPPDSEATPDTPDFLAQANQDSGGDGVEKIRPEIAAPEPLVAEEPSTATIAVSGTGTPSAEPAPRHVQTQDARNLLELPAEAKSAQPEPAQLAQTADGSESTPVSISTQAAVPPPTHDTDAIPPASRSAALAALSAEIERRLLAYPERPRRKWISARTQEHTYAAYMDAWRRKIERIGNLHYPDDAAQRGLAGSLLLEVALNPDGTVEEIALRRSSGRQILDDAAIRIVNLAAPFARFPDTIAQEVDVLHIERTWIFHSSSGFPSQ